MRKRLFYPLVTTCLLLTLFFQTTAAAENLESVVDYLLEYVKGSESLFIRNNREYAPAEAAAHMRKKYEHFRERIKTPEDFIRLVGTKSLLSGKAYEVRMKSGEIILTQKWLECALDKYRKNKNEGEGSGKKSAERTY